MGRIRHRQPLQHCRVQSGGDRLFIEFDHSQRAIAPGQFVALYSGDECLGGGVIQSAVPLAGQSSAAARSQQAAKA
jgi:tRNA-specific 2-thiouridylase